MKKPDEQLAILKCGVVDLISDDELLEKLERSWKEKTPLRIKYGADPSAPDIHLGHTVPLRKLRQFQDLGHQVIFIIGDFTAMVGDPSGVSKTRKQLTREQVLENAKTYQEQIFKILDPDRTEVVFNSHWLASMQFGEILTLTSKYNVARMMERDDFSKRYKEGKQITILEFIYPLMQGYDSVVLESDVEIGGTDQTFNLLVARDIQKEYGCKQQAVITLPILEGTDGVQKMSKSLGNYIGVNETPLEIFGKLMSISDDLMLRYYDLLTTTSSEDIKLMTSDIASGKTHPMDAKKKLAKIIISQLYCSEDADQAEEEFTRVFSHRELPTEIEEYHWNVDDKSIWIVGLLEQTGLVSSKSEARRMISQGAVSIDGNKITDNDQNISVSNDMIVKVGKRRFKRIVIDK